MKEIELTQGKIALVDDEDYDYLMQWHWCARRNKNNFYAHATIYKGNKSLKMHRVILGLTDPKIFPDHIDRNGLNNQRSNLRIVTQSQNEANKTSHRDSTSKYKGVSWIKKRKKWISQICKNRINIVIGFFDNENDAALAYNNAAKELHGQFANLNSV